jgi:predicted NBD/HSP70 family sugar kinase
MSAVFAVDLGATFLRTALVDAEQQIRRRTVEPTPSTASGCAAVIRAAWRAAARPYPVAIAAAPLCDARGRVLRWPNRPDYEGCSIVPSEWGDEVLILDDGHAAALAAHATAATDDVTVSLQIGTGIGAGAVVGGRLLAGRTASAMALGHIKVPAARGLPCSCRETGCLQAAASGRAFRRMLSGDGHAVADIFALPQEVGGPVLARAADAIAEALTLIVKMFDPHCLAIGGSLGLSPLFDMCASRLPACGGQIAPIRHPAGVDAPLIGVARMARSVTT